MIIQCQGCAAKYFLPEDKVPENPIKVSCPKCTAVFTLAPQAEPVAAGIAAGQVPGMAAAPEVQAPEPIAAQAAAPVVPVAPKAPAAPPEEPAAAPEPPAPAAEPKPAKGKGKGKGKGRKKEDRAKRLARVLVSDILCYNQEKRDQALQDGTLMTVLGEEIKKSWELYKDKVGPDVASSTNYFKEALNEILADGQEVF
jgi:predicted Zn finger-like uncharacterized protein